MKWKFLLLLVVLLSIFLSGCNRDDPLEFSCEDFREVNHRTAEIEVGVGQEFRVTLCSNPTTGHVWSNAFIDPAGFVEQVGHQYLGPDGSAQQELVGQAGEEVWRFKAFIAGESTISLDYHQPWDDGEKSAWTYTLAVTVK